MTARIETSRARAPEARCRLAALLRRAPGATVRAPRRVLCALLDAVDAAERRADALAEDLARARAAFADSLRDRDALAAALDAADVREAAVLRAACDRAAALAAVHPRAVEGYLEAKGWHPGRRAEGGRGFEVWRHPHGAVAAWPDAGADRAAALWDVACACGRVEGRHPTQVLAAWLANDGGGSR